MTWVVIAFAIVILAGIAFAIARASRRSTVDATVGDRELDDGVVSEPVPVAPRFDASQPSYVPTSTVASSLAPTADERAAAPQSRPMRWCRQFETPGVPLSDDARLKLITDLGLLRAPWSDEILTLALAEETSPALLAALRAALDRQPEGAI